MEFSSNITTSYQKNDAKRSRIAGDNEDAAGHSDGRETRRRARGQRDERTLGGRTIADSAADINRQTAGRSAEGMPRDTEQAYALTHLYYSTR